MCKDHRRIYTGPCDARLAMIDWLCAILDEAKTTEKVPV